MGSRLASSHWEKRKKEKQLQDVCSSGTLTSHVWNNHKNRFVVIILIYTTKKLVHNTDISTISLPPTEAGPITRGLTHKHHCPHELDEVIARRPYGELCWVPHPPALNSSSFHNRGRPLLRTSHAQASYFWSQTSIIFSNSFSLCLFKVDQKVWK